MNPLGMDSIKREMPIFDLDTNMIFPGSETGAVAEHIAAAIMNDIKGADICIDIHASNIFLREIPQVRISEETAPKLLPYAKMLNVDFIWVHSSVTVMEATLSHSLNKAGTPTLVAEMGAGMRITKSYGDQLLLLVTCDYDEKDGRFVLALRKLRDTETAGEVASLIRQVQ